MVAVLCRCANEPTSKRARLNEGTIAYPFVGEARQLGRNGKKDKFVIRSAVGAAEYAVEIPDAGNGYDIQVPLAELNPPATSEAIAIGARGAKAPNPVATDKELVNSLPSLAKASPAEVATLDAALGVGSADGPIQSPSYTMGIAKVNQYYRERNFELALMELNNAISFYPNSPKLLKMKGTLLLKTGNQELALKAWQRASDLDPADRNLDRALKRLQDRLVASQAAAANMSGPRALNVKVTDPVPAQAPSPVIPAPPLDPELDALAH